MTYPNLVMEQLLFIARIVCTGQSIKIKNREHQQSCHDYSDKSGQYVSNISIYLLPGLGLFSTFLKCLGELLESHRWSGTLGLNN